MERLRKAMERARAERQQRLTRTPSVPAPTHGERSTRPVGQADGTGIQPQYRRTARLSFDPHALLNGRILLLDDRSGQASVHEGVADAYRILHTQILHRLRAKSYRTLAITSPGSGDGKTTTAINLAISLARDADQSVLLVDCDLKHPSIGGFFARRDSLGLVDYLMGHAELEDVLLNPGIEQLTILPGSTRFRRASKQGVSPHVVQLLDVLKRHPEDWLILLDMPPLLDDDDAIALLPYVDAVILVVEDGKVSRQELVNVYELLGEQCIGLVLNKAKANPVDLS